MFGWESVGYLVLFESSVFIVTDFELLAAFHLALHVRKKCKSKVLNMKYRKYIISIKYKSLSYVLRVCVNSFKIDFE